MQNQKMENLLNLALDASEEGRRKSLDLDVGYQPETRRWQVIVRYSGDLKAYESPEIRIAELTGGYAIVTLSESRLHVFAALPEVEYMEMPKRLFFSLNQARSVSCVQPVQEAPRSLTGQGVLVAVVDSGADWRHPDFQTADGRSRIVLLWDQTLEGPPPEGYTYGTEFTGRELDAALAAKREGGLPGATGSPQAAGGLGREDRPPASASRDVSGHGTGVLALPPGTAGPPGASTGAWPRRRIFWW